MLLDDIYGVVDLVNNGWEYTIPNGEYNIDIIIQATKNGILIDDCLEISWQELELAKCIALNIDFRLKIK